MVQCYANKFDECLKEEWKDGKVVKICTIQHKGTTLMEIHKVSKSAIYLRTEKKIRDTFGTLEKNNYSLIHYPKTFDNFLKFLI
jgi:hypothetical protein